MNQTQTTYGPPRCDATGLCEPQTSPPTSAPGATTTIVSVHDWGVDSSVGAVQASVETNTRAVAQLHKDFIGIGLLLFVILFVIIIRTAGWASERKG